MEARDRGPIGEAAARELKAEKAALDLSLDELAVMADVPRSTLNKYLTGASALTLDRAEQIAGAMDMTLIELLRRAEARIARGMSKGA